MPFPGSLAPTCRPDLEMLAVRWLTTVSRTTLRAEYEAVLATGEAHHSHRWLFDVRCRPATTPEAADWVTTDWLHRAAALVRPHRLRLAYLVTPARADTLPPGPLLRTLLAEATTPAQPYDLALFTDEGAAMRWLLA